MIIDEYCPNCKSSQKTLLREDGTKYIKFKEKEKVKKRLPSWFNFESISNYYALVVIIWLILLYFNKIELTDPLWLFRAIVLIFLIIAPWTLIRMFNKNKEEKENLYNLINFAYLLPENDESVNVNFKFHLYSGFLFYVRQQEVNLTMPHNSSLIILREMHKFNLRRGLFAYGFILVPIISLLNYYLQINSIKRQLNHD